MTELLLAIDPGPAQSAYCIIATDTREPLDFGKVDNADLRELLFDDEEEWAWDRVVVEMIASYGMPVGAEVFQTCVWIGRFTEILQLGGKRVEAELIGRQAVKLHHCHSNKANDGNVRQALVDRFAPGQPNHGKGTKAKPGWFNGFAADVWAAYALAVYAADTEEQQ